MRKPRLCRFRFHLSHLDGRTACAEVLAFTSGMAVDRLSIIAPDWDWNFAQFADGTYRQEVAS